MIRVSVYTFLDICTFTLTDPNFPWHGKLSQSSCVTVAGIQAPFHHAAADLNSVDGAGDGEVQPNINTALCTLGSNCSLFTAHQLLCLRNLCT